MTEVYVGTSGWSYSWNLGNSLDWYVQNTGLPAIELNMSFYRFPYPNMVKSWSVKGKDLAWVVKVHRSITHFQKLSPVAATGFERFKKLFAPLEDSIHYYLFQLPPSFTDLDRLDHFIQMIGTEKLAIEFRHTSLFTDEIKTWGDNHKVLLVSIDAPHLPTKVMNDQIVYERIHGRTGWYSHNYNDAELQEIKARILAGHPERVYVFFNNNHAMLENAVRMLRLLEKP
ncbi:MAG TPA: DUF72 domain-containing protein [Candidatus Thermoplasmatota archaeon]|nr:DUF72 domain-containing protein [Candidatus Thermoplasmatota archaeon]